MRIRKLACHRDRTAEKCSSCSLNARARVEFSFARDEDARVKPRVRASIGTVDAFGVRLLVTDATFKLANRTMCVERGAWRAGSVTRGAWSVAR
jgi:hypothetical protein